MSLNEPLACLNRNRLLYLNMLEVLRRGRRAAHAGEGGCCSMTGGRGLHAYRPGPGRPGWDVPLLPADCTCWWATTLVPTSWPAASACGKRSCASRPPGQLRAGGAFGGSCTFGRRPYVCEHYSKSDIGGLDTSGRPSAGMLGPSTDAGGLRGLPARAPSAFWRCLPTAAGGL